MPRRGLVILLAALLALVVATLVVMLSESRDELGPTSEPASSDATRRGPEPREDRAALVPSLTKRVEVEVDLEPDAANTATDADTALDADGDTPFQRRLAAGEEFRELHQLLRESCAPWPDLLAGGVELDEWADAFAPLPRDEFERLRDALRPLQERFVGALPAVLSVEGLPLALRSPPTGFDAEVWHMSEALAKLASPPVDLTTIGLGISRSEALDDRLGRGRLLRIWARRETAKRDLPLGSEARSCEVLVRQLFAISNASRGPGFDLLMAEKLGAEIFPRVALLKGAAGFYTRSDRLCVVESPLPPRFRRHVMRHELVHAFSHQVAPRGPAPSFIKEGLAEYLAHLEPEDEAFDIPPERLADDFARLVALLRYSREFLEVDRLHPAKLARLTQAEFYFLRYMGYLLAEATMAFIDAQAIELAFRSKSYAPIRKALEEIEWTVLLAFIEQYAPQGEPTRSLVGLDAPEIADPALLRKVLEKLGIPLSPDEEPDPSLFGSRPATISVSEVVAEMTRGEEPILMLCDLSRGLDAPAFAGAGETRRSLLAEFTTKLERMTGQSIVQAGLAQRPWLVDGELETTDDPFTAMELASWLRSKGHRYEKVVIVVASPDWPARREVVRTCPIDISEVGEEELSTYYASQFATAEDRPRVFLIVDLGDDDTDAKALARGLRERRAVPEYSAYLRVQRRRE